MAQAIPFHTSEPEESLPALDNQRRHLLKVAENGVRFPFGRFSTVFKALIAGSLPVIRAFLIPIPA